MHISKDLWKLHKDFSIFAAIRKLFKPTWTLRQWMNGVNQRTFNSSGYCRLCISSVVDFKRGKEISQITLKVVEW